MQLQVLLADDLRPGDVIVDAYMSLAGKGRAIPKGRLVTVNSVEDCKVRDDYIEVDGWYSLGRQRLPWTTRYNRNVTVHTMEPVDADGFLPVEDPAVTHGVV
jgi:hypothetical protein